MGSHTITRAALGSSAALGDLYDARRDDFCGISIFKKSIPKKAVSLTDSHFSDISLVHSDEFSEKFNKLDVNGELSVSVLAGLFALSGCGRYLCDEKKSARTVKSSLIYNIKTKEESVNIYHEDLKNAFSIDAIKNGAATHVVVGISWGANSVVSCQYENKENRDVREISGNLSAHLEKLKFAISGKGSVDFKEGTNSNAVKFNIRMFGDVLSKDEDLPTTFEGALALMKKLPRLVAKSNEGRGKPLSYRLLPISLLKKYLKFSIKADSTIKTLEEDSLIRVVQLFEQMSAVQQQLYDLYQDTLEFKFCVKPEDIVKISEFKENMAIQEASLRSELAKILVKIRSGKKDVSKLEDLLKKIQSSDVSPQKVSNTLAIWGELTEKINFARKLVRNEVTYIGLGSSLDEKILEDFDQKSYILYFTQRARTEDADTWNGNRQLFFQEINKNDEDNNYYAVDCDIHPNLIVANTTSCVQVVQAGRVLIKNLLEEQRHAAQFPLAQAFSGTERFLYKPNNRVPLNIACTGKNCHPGRTYDWVCKNCLTIFDYGFDRHVYCECGKTPVTRLEFKCTDPKHGLAFERHEDKKFLIELVKQLKPFKEMNILILGETGVGKSTWINGFINFLAFESLEDAEMGELCTLIPTNFTVYDEADEGFNEILVSTGSDRNEAHQGGQSATQSPKVYPFNIGNTTIRLIDTPGIGDTRGIEQDKKNFENILGTLSNLEELHGICILLKPNNARLNVTFRFCIKELLTYLHRDASKNIMFCFTNSRGTLYRPGDTMPALKTLLLENKDVEIPINPHTVYCYDSEAYRFLAALKNNPPVRFTDPEKANFSNSWKKSIEETGRMLKHIKTLKPHKIKSTVNLNHSRQLVLRLARPLAEISKNIETNKSFVEDEMEEIEETEESIEKLKKKQYISRTKIKVKKINHPKTVCSKSSCVKVRSERVCHSRCHLDDIQFEGDGDLLRCKAFRYNDKCKECGHSYKYHLHIYYDSIQVTKQVEDKSVTKALAKKLNAAEMKQMMIEAKTEEIEEYESQLDEIKQASVKFAYFLKKNSITPYNDAIEDYFDHFIRVEMDKVDSGGDETVLCILKKFRKSYKKEKNLLEAKMKVKKGTCPDQEEIEKLVHELQKIKYSGKSLKDALKCVEHTKSVVYQEVTVNNSIRGNLNIYNRMNNDDNLIVKCIKGLDSPVL